METLSVLQSLIMALWVAAIMSRWLGGGATLTLRFALNDRVSSRFSDGRCPESDDCHRSITNDLHGCFSPGGSMPAEPSIAAAIAVPVRC